MARIRRPRVTNTTLVDTCNFPSNRFGVTYTGQLPNDTVDTTRQGRDRVTHPASSTVTERTIASTGRVEFNNTRVQHLPSVQSQVARGRGSRVIVNAGGDKTNANIETTRQGRARVISTFGGPASDQNVTTTARGATVTGKSC